MCPHNSQQQQSMNSPQFPSLDLDSLFGDEPILPATACAPVAQLIPASAPAPVPQQEPASTHLPDDQLAADIAAMVASQLAAEVQTQKQVPSLEEVKAEMATRCSDPSASQSDRESLTEGWSLITQWQEGKLKVHNQSFSTPVEIIKWVTSNPALVPKGLYWHVKQTTYNTESSDFKHFYTATSVKRTLDLVALEYGIPLSELYQKFGGESMYKCIKTGKDRCKRVCNGGFYCHVHKDSSTGPYEDYQVWKQLKVPNV